jgi:hypothetical protein
LAYLLDWMVLFVEKNRAHGDKRKRCGSILVQTAYAAGQTA